MFHRLLARFRALYHWTLRWASHPKAPIALAVLAFTESSIFPIPPDVLLIAMVVALPAYAFRYATITTLASVIGGVAGYLIGQVFYDTIGVTIIAFYHAQALVAEIGRRYEMYAFLTVFTAAFTPIPYKVITISAGFFGISFIPFLVASATGRALRFFLVAGLLKFFGKRMKDFIERHFDKLTIVFMIVFIGGFLALKFMF